MTQIVAISIYVNDLDKAVAFYSEVLGFAVKARPVPFIVELEHEGPALVLCQAERPERLDYSKASGTVVGIMVKDLAAKLRELTAKKVELIHKTPEEFPGGKFVALRDPAGNVIELLQFGA
ncbi:MAG: VOC family protein [Gemmatimonadales bacterium]|nr:VOC family protein [Gemmatimonadales bacterium]